MNTFCERFLKPSSCTIQYLQRLLQYGDVPELFSLIAQRPKQLQLGEGDNLITQSDQDQIKQVVKKHIVFLEQRKILIMCYTQEGINLPGTLLHHFSKGI